MVKVDGSVEAYQWSQIDSKWMKVGEVVGSAGGSSGTRTLHEGKVGTDYRISFIIWVKYKYKNGIKFYFLAGVGPGRPLCYLRRSYRPGHC